MEKNQKQHTYKKTLTVYAVSFHFVSPKPDMFC